MSVDAKGTKVDNSSNTTTSTRLDNDNKSWEDLLLEQEIIKRFANKWNILDHIFFGVVVLMALELLNVLVKYGGRKNLFFGNASNTKQIPVRGKHLDNLRPIDYLFISMNKAATPPFVYFLMRYLYFEDNNVVSWSLHSLTLMNTIVPLPFIYVIYDFF